MFPLLNVYKNYHFQLNKQWSARQIANGRDDRCIMKILTPLRHFICLTSCISFHVCFLQPCIQSILYFVQKRMWQQPRMHLTRISLVIIGFKEARETCHSVYNLHNVKGVPSGLCKKCSAYLQSTLLGKESIHF